MRFYYIISSYEMILVINVYIKNKNKIYFNIFILKTNIITYYIKISIILLLLNINKFKLHKNKINCYCSLLLLNLISEL